MQGKSLAQAATQFLAGLSPPEREQSQQELNKFVRWYGMERPVREVAAHEVANYAERMEGSSANAMKRLEPVRAFLSYAKKEGLTQTNLAVHLRVKKSSPKRGLLGKERRKEVVALTPQGYQKLKEELLALQGQRPKIADQIRRAAADKDFRENAPLDAAKDYQGKIEARIRELEEILKSAVLAAKEVDTTKVTRGCTVVLQDLSSGEELRYTLVHPNEASPTKGKISVASPTAKALLGRRKGEVVEVAAPVGTLRYRIEKIEG
ncbi:MAG: transcription elongation factor GreA [Dehalococcoidia bacterium]|nr:MAG: transcription elongation factor GreA [Dehalococcoidia bacterium]